MSAKKAVAESAHVTGVREFEHTGDMGIALTADTRAELFRRAAVAMGSLLVEPAGVMATEEREIVVASDTDADLMHDLLTELLDLFAEGFIWSDAAVEELDGSLKLTVRGEGFDPARHEFNREIKAVTYHQLEVLHGPKGWSARVIFDV